MWVDLLVLVNVLVIWKKNHLHIKDMWHPTNHAQDMELDVFLTLKWQ